MLTLRNTFLAVRLHGDVGIQVVQGTVGLLAAVPTAFVHTFDLLITSTGPFVLLGARDRYEAEDLDAQTR